MTSLNQKIVRRLRSVLSSKQQEYFSRVFLKRESECNVRRELGCVDSFEAQLLQALRQPQPGDHCG